MDGRRKAFYKKGRQGTLSCVDAEDEESRMVTVSVSRNTSVRYLNREDWSPIEIGYLRHVPGIEGTQTALLNYGGFLRSSSARGFQILQDVFESKNSFMPSFMKDKMPSFPRYHKDAVEFSGGRVVLIGDTMVSKVKITTNSSEVKYINITDDPKEVVVTRFVD